MDSSSPLWSLNLYAWPSIGLESVMESGICYGYCSVYVISIFFMTAIFHQGLRVLSVPAFAHNAVNAIGALLLYAQSNLVMWDSWLFLVVPCGSMASLFFLVHWKYHQTKTAIEKTESKSSTMVQKGLESMENLHFMLSLLRYFAVALFSTTIVAGESFNSL
jgi:hypothetical protein